MDEGAGRSGKDPVAAGLFERAAVDAKLASLVGVTLHDPARIWVDPEVEVAPGAVIWAGAVLRGHTRVGAAEIGVGAVLIDTEVADGAVVKAYSVCEGASIGPGASVGPMAHLRAGSDLRADVKVGNFVEVKATVLHAGAKASHLTYLGDAEIGADANIGAGTITCNYDGFNKWRTVIGAGAFIGSNSSLVAPVTVGTGAIVGAGSAITGDVPDQALAVERSETRTVANGAPRIRAKNQKIKESRRG